MLWMLGVLIRVLVVGYRYKYLVVLVIVFMGSDSNNIDSKSK